MQDGDSKWSYNQYYSNENGKSLFQKCWKASSQHVLFVCIEYYPTKKNVGIRETMMFLYAFRFVCVLATHFCKLKFSIFWS